MAESEQNLKEMWKKLEERFKAKTGRDLKPKSTKTLEEIKKKLELQESQIPPDEPEKKDAKRRAKDAGLDILYCLKLLGGLAAQGASIVSVLANLSAKNYLLMIIRSLVQQTSASMQYP
jgi:hypothetical protein